jgi:shikimate kinase
MGSGKTTLAKKLARRIGFTHLDTDQMIEQKSGMTVVEIFRHLGESTFRELESGVLRDTQTKERVVISTGGGLPCHGNHMEWMNQNGITVYLDATIKLLKDRLIRGKAGRPLLKNIPEEDFEQAIGALLNGREPYYLMAGVRVKLPLNSVETLVKSIGLKSVTVYPEGVNPRKSP